VVQWFLFSKAATPAQARKGRLLAGWLLLAWILAWIDVVLEVTQPAGFVNVTMLVTIAIITILYVLNRRGAVAATADGLILLLISIIVVFSLDPAPDPLMIGLNPVFMVVPILVAGAFLEGAGVLVVSAGCALVAIWLYYWGIPQMPGYRAAYQPDMVVLVSGVVFALLGTGGISWLSSFLLRATQKDLQTESEARRQLAARLLTAQEDERRRIARDLHDGALGDLSAVILAIDLLNRRPGAAGVQQTDLQTLRGQIREVSGHLRELMNNLRPTLLDDVGLPAALNHLASKTQQRTNLPIQVHIALDQRLDPQREIVIYRVTQEALNNIAQHTHATHVALNLTQQKGGWQLEITDNGPGFDPVAARQRAAATGHIGLASLIERVEGVGGHVQFLTAPGHGTTLCCWFPDTWRPPASMDSALPEVVAEPGVSS
jgi:signal transduction histidine kinase